MFLYGLGCGWRFVPDPGRLPPSQSHLLASPQGYIENDGQLHFIVDCDAYATRKLVLIHSDSAKTWRGDLNYCGIAWNTRTSALRSTVLTTDVIELTLLGGEKIVFGKAILTSGDQVALPAGYVTNKTIALAFPKSATNTGHPTHGFAAWVDTSGALHHPYQDGEGNHWEGLGQSFVCSFLNNNGTWRSATNGWFYCPLTDGKVLAVAGHSIQTATRTISGYTPLAYILGDHVPPLDGMTSDSIQVMTGPNAFDIVDHPAHGVKQCYVDGDLFSICDFEDGEGNEWSGGSGVFSLLCETPTGTLDGNVIPADPTTWPGTVTTYGGGGGDGGGDGGGGGGLES